MSTQKPITDPLKIFLTRPWRIAIMTVLISSFFIIAPLLVLYTSGFRYDTKNHEFTTTGVISVDTKPQDAEVYVNNKYIGNTQPLRLDGLVPGIYEVRVSKTGYYDFNTILTVRSHETSYIKGVTLWQKNNAVLLQKIPGGSITQVGINSNTPTNYFFVTQNSSSSTLHVVSQVAESFETKSFSSHNEGNHIFTCSQIKNHCAWWSNSEKKIKIVSLDDTNTVLSFFASSYRWQWSGNKTTLGFLETSNGIQAIDRNYTLHPSSHSTSSVWFIDNQGVQIAVAIPKTTTQIIDGTSESFAILKNPESIEVITDVKTTAARQTIRANNYIHHYSNHRWLLWSPWEIISVNDTNGQSGIIYRSAEPIDQVIGLEPTGSIMMISKNRIIAFNPGYFTTQELASFDRIQTASVDEKSRTIIIAGTKDTITGIYTLNY